MLLVRAAVVPAVTAIAEIPLSQLIFLRIQVRLCLAPSATLYSAVARRNHKLFVARYSDISHALTNECRVRVVFVFASEAVPQCSRRRNVARAPKRFSGRLKLEITAAILFFAVLIEFSFYFIYLLAPRRCQRRCDV